MSKSSWVLLIAAVAFGYWYEVLRPKQTGTATNAGTVPSVATAPSTLPMG
ncbi:MAG: hypothetical protein KGI08_10535 [Thaumarchaeota archaeon]|nr:hypothetical protein [Nitrososphaerota archaeon]